MSELTQLIEQEIPDGRQNLQENFSNLEKVAQYCQENYIQVCRETSWLCTPTHFQFLVNTN